MFFLCLNVGCFGVEEPVSGVDGHASGVGESGEWDVSSGEELPNLEPLSPFESLQAEVFVPHCANGGCHGGAPSMSNGMLGLDSDATYENLVGVAPFNGNAQAAGLNLVTPGSLEESFLWEKMVIEEAHELYGNPMPPLAFPRLDEASMSRVRDWIESGAEP